MTFDAAADFVSRAVGHAAAIPVACVVIIVTHLFLGIDATNFSISVVSLMLLFLIQHSQNRDGLAIQVKLDKIIEGTPADSHFIGLDKRPEKEIRELRDD